MKIYSKWALLLILLLFISSFGSGCGGGSNTPSKPDENTGKETSDDYGTILVNNRYLLLNNVWNKGAATKGFQQKIFSKTVEGKTVFGWEWVNPFPYSNMVVSYPEVIYGDKPWDKPSGRVTEFPFKAGSKEITANYKITNTNNGIYNISFSLWAVSSLPAAINKISHEIMIWTVNSGMSSVGTKQAAPLEVNGTKFDVYVNNNHSDASGYYSNKWTFIAFVAQEPVLNGPLNINTFTGYLIDQKILSSDSYLTSLELGNEVVGGAGKVEISDYQVTIK